MIQKIKKLFEMDTKYKIVETTGCTAFDFSINEKSISEYNEKELDEILDYLFIKVKEGIKENTILFENLVHLFQYDDYEHDPNQCEQCFDTIQTTTWKI